MSIPIEALAPDEHAAADPEAAQVSNPALVDNATVEMVGVSKWFGNKVAVSDITCSFGPGITGVLGPNGAGKTTLLRMATGLLRCSEGGVTVFGHEPRKNPAAYERVGLVPEDDSVYGFLTARQFVGYAAKLGRRDASRSAVESALEKVSMMPAADRLVSEFSKGMRQRTKVAAALVTEPELLVLDEPLNGTDPKQRARLIALFHEMAANGHTLIVSSHVLAEVERMTDRVLAILDGKLAAAGGVRGIRAAMSDIPQKVRIDADYPRRLAGALIEMESVVGLQVRGDGLDVETADVGELSSLLPSTALRCETRIVRFEVVDASLESVFRHLVRSRR